MRRAAHKDFETTRLYLREAENLAAGFGQVFPPLPPAARNRPEIVPGDSCPENPSDFGCFWWS